MAWGVDQLEDAAGQAAYDKLKRDGNLATAMERFITSGDYDEELIDSRELV